MTEEDRSEIHRVFSALYTDLSADEAAHMHEMIEDTFNHLNPVILLTQGQFQSVNDKVFTVDGTVFSSWDVCHNLRRSEYVFPHIISSGPEIEEYALTHTDKMWRKIIRKVCAASNETGRAILINKLIEDYGIEQVLPIYPGEPGWALQEGLRIFDIFEKEATECGLGITKIGTPNVAYTCYGLMSGN